MLATYTIVFTQIYKAKWGIDTKGTDFEFAINLFAGLIVFNLVAEVATKAPSLIMQNPNYVKKVIFPLEILSITSVLASTFHAITSVGVLLVLEAYANMGHLPITLLLLPLVWLPLILGCITLALILSAIGVYIRDIGQIAGILVSVLLFLSPVFYPVSAVPEKLRTITRINPIASVIEETRKVAVANKMPSTSYLLNGTLSGIVGCDIAYLMFKKLRGGFGDVI
jgi:lipopolysaccharide transport system permease protein